MSNRIAHKKKLLFSGISLEVSPSYPPPQTKVIIPLAIHVFLHSFNKSFVTKYYSPAIILEADDKVCSLTITS